MNIKNWTYYFFIDVINIKFFDTNLLKIEIKSYKNIDIYYITIKNVDDYEKIYSVNPLYLIIGELDECIEEKTGVNISFLIQWNCILQMKARKC